MTAQLIDGKVLAEKIKGELTEQVKTLKKSGKDPYLFAVQVGQDPASAVYTRNQAKTCEEIGLGYTLDGLPEDTSETDLIRHIQGLNQKLEEKDAQIAALTERLAAVEKYIDSMTEK